MAHDGFFRVRRCCGLLPVDELQEGAFHRIALRVINLVDRSLHAP
jgi:hypothetical protein